MKKDHILALWCIGIVLTSCKQGREPTDRVISVPEPVYISGYIEGNTPRKDSILLYFGGEMPSSSSRGAGVYKVYVPVDRKGKFHFTSPPIDDLERMTMFSLRRRKGEKGARYNDGLRNYIVEPGDSISIIVDHRKEETSFSFSGRGAQKYRCRWEADQLGYFVHRNHINEKIQKYGIQSLYGYEKKVEVADSLTTVQYRKLQQYRKDLTPRVYEILKADITGINNRFLKMYEPRVSENLAVYRRMIEEFEKDGIDQEVMAMSVYYIEYLYQMITIKLFVEHDGAEDYTYPQVYMKKFGELCAKLREDYTGALREKLLLYSLQATSIQDTYGLDNCIRESYSLIKTPALKEIMENWRRRKVRGVEAYNFVLPDTTGHMVKLKDFRGKVVYVDIWFTGCFGCILLAEQVDKKVYPKFRDNPDVVFISISFDKDRERWLKSVREEKYGLKEYINLYTDGKGMEHPLIQYYDIQGGPTTMIIDKNGKIFSAAPPKPQEDHDNEKISGLVSLIEDALTE